MILALLAVSLLVHWVSCKGVVQFEIPPNKPYPGTPANERWDYTEVRPGSSLFWWLYRSPAFRTDPLIIFLHGGPGTSATADSNFAEFGVFDLDFNRRNRSSSYIGFASLLYVDAPAGTGFSFLINPLDYSFTKEQAAEDLVVWFQDFLLKNPTYRKVPIHLISESFGVRWAVVFANKLSLLQQKWGIRVKSVTMSGPFVNFYDHVSDYSDFLYAFSLSDDVQKHVMDQQTDRMVNALAANDYIGASIAAEGVSQLNQPVSYGTYPLNVLYDFNQESIKTGGIVKFGQNLYTAITWINGGNTRFAPLMNGAVRQYLKVPTIWASEVLGTESVMLPVDEFRDLVPDIDHLLMFTNISLVLVVDQLELTYNLPSQYRWMSRLTWPHRQQFMQQQRKVFNGELGFVRAYRKHFQKLSLYSVFNSGHEVPYDQPVVLHNIIRHVLDGNP